MSINMIIGINNEFVMLFVIFIFFIGSLIIALRSQGYYKSIIGFSGMCLIGLTIIWNSFLVNNELSYVFIIMNYVFQGILYLISIGMLYFSIFNLFQQKGE
jgi:hypothetical protein